MERLVESLGVTSRSKSPVSVMATGLDEAVEAFRTRPLDTDPYNFGAFVSTLKLRQAGFTETVDAEDTFRNALRSLNDHKFLPPAAR